MARHAVRAGSPEPKAAIKAAPSEYERTHPVGSAERFLDQAAKEALTFAAAGGIPPPSRFVPGAVRAVAKKAGEYPDPLLAEAAGLPAKELARRAANAEAYRKAIDAQNAVVDTASLVTSPAGNMAANLLGANTHDALTRQDWDGGDSERKEAIRPDRYPSLFFTGEDFDSDALVKDAAKAGKSPREILRLFYGDQTDRILTEAAAARGNRYREAVGQMVTVGRPETDNFDTDVQNPGRYDLPYNVEDKDETEDPMQRWFRKMVDSFAGPTQSRAYSREGKAAIWGGRGWAHEITGHLMNPVQNTKADIDLREQQNSLGNSTRYYISNNSELAAALGNLRKQMFKRTGGKVDIKDPDMLRAVFRDYARNPRMYNGRWLSHDARALLRSWTDVPSNAQIDQEWDKRWRKVHLDMLRDPQFTNKVVANNTVDHQSHADAKGGDTRQDWGGGKNSETPVSEAPVQQDGPRIVINPTTFHNRKDALCVAFNEGFRVWMEVNGFEPVSEPTEAQRKFFSDTAYADDEVQLRRTILARIATFDTSVKDPTDDQLSETASFLGAVLESGWCRNDWERDSVSRLMNAVQSAVGAEPVEPRQEPLEAREAEPLQRHAAMGGGETEDEEEKSNLTASNSGDGGEGHDNWVAGDRVDMGNGKYFIKGGDVGTGAIYGAGDNSVIHSNVTGFTAGKTEEGFDRFTYKSDTGSDREDIYVPKGLRASGSATWVDMEKHTTSVNGKTVTETVVNHENGAVANLHYKNGKFSSIDGRVSPNALAAENHMDQLASDEELKKTLADYAETAKGETNPATEDRGQPKDGQTGDSREQVVTANGTEPGTQTKTNVAAENKTTDQMLAQGEKILPDVGKDGNGANKDNAAAGKNGNAGNAGSRIGGQSGIWTGGEPGKGRQLTAREAEWARQRAASGGSMRTSDLTMLGLVPVGQDAGGDQQAGAPTVVAAPADAGPDRKLSMNGPAIKPRRRIGDMGSRSLTNIKKLV